MFENGVDNVPANGNNINDDTKDTVSGNKQVAVASKRKKLNKRIKKKVVKMFLVKNY